MTYNQAALICFVLAALMYYWPWLKDWYCRLSCFLWWQIEKYRRNDRKRYAKVLQSSRGVPRQIRNRNH